MRILSDEQYNKLVDNYVDDNIKSRKYQIYKQDGSNFGFDSENHYIEFTDLDGGYHKFTFVEDDENKVIKVINEDNEEVDEINYPSNTSLTE